MGMGKKSCQTVWPGMALKQTKNQCKYVNTQVALDYVAQRGSISSY